VRIFVCSPLRGDEKLNIGFALDLCRKVAMAGHSPFAPHVFCTRFLSDHDSSERDRGIGIGVDFLSVCDELWWAIPEWHRTQEPSPGMVYEMETARTLGIPVRRMGV
jgi:hypothetical protein